VTADRRSAGSADEAVRSTSREMADTVEEEEGDGGASLPAM